jgi:polysaccharide biosynthesis protein PelA
MNPLKSLLATFALTALSSGAHAADASREKWAVYYTHALAPEKFLAYDLLVFDSEHHPALAPLKSEGRTILGYLSLGEAEEYRSDFKMLKSQKLLLGPNTAWKGHHMVDVRRKEWESHVNETLIPAILAKGFDGIMFDTIDSVTYLEVKDPKRYAGMQKASVDLLRSIRARHPHMKIMVNRGFDILPEFAPYVDMILAESTYTTVVKKLYNYYVQKLKDSQASNPALKVYSLDYWPLKDKEGVKHIYAAQRAQGYSAYVSHPALQNLAEEPK